MITMFKYVHIAWNKEIKVVLISWNKVKHLSEEIKQKMRKAHPSIRGINNPMFGKKQLALTEWNRKQDRKGKNNPAWQGGISFLPYSFSRFSASLSLKPFLSVFNF